MSRRADDSGAAQSSFSTDPSTSLSGETAAFSLLAPELAAVHGAAFVPTAAAASSAPREQAAHDTEASVHALVSSSYTHRGECCGMAAVRRYRPHPAHFQSPATATIRTCRVNSGRSCAPARSQCGRNELTRISLIRPVSEGHRPRGPPHRRRHARRRAGEGSGSACGDCRGRKGAGAGVGRSESLRRCCCWASRCGPVVRRAVCGRNGVDGCCGRRAAAAGADAVANGQASGAPWSPPAPAWAASRPTGDRWRRSRIPYR